MFSKAANSTPVVPSRNALRVLRQLALAGSTVGGLCAVATITYDVHRRVRIAEQIIENKRTIRTSAPNYDATASAKRLSAMMEAAEAGEFLGLESFKRRQAAAQTEPQKALEEDATVDNSFMPPPSTPKPGPPFTMNKIRVLNLPPAASASNRTKHQLAVAREKQETDETSGASLEYRVQELLDQDRDIDAANLFLQEVQPSPDGLISWEWRELACKVFSVNCQKKNLYVARPIFERLEKVSFMDKEVWSMMIHSLAREGHIDSAATIFERHRTKLTLPEHLLEIVIRCLIESRRLNTAKWLFYTRMKQDRDGGLCGAYLDGIWRKTRNSTLLTAEFRRVLARLASLDRKPTEKVFNPLVKAYIESGKFEDAEALVHDMPEKYGVPPGCRALGLLLYGRALECKWDDVMAGLREMHELGLTQEKRDFCRVFDRIFLEYYPAHSGSQIYDFLVTCINEFELVPDKTLHRHILEAIVERGDANMMEKITRMAEDREWNSGLKEKSFVHILEGRRVSMESTPVGNWRMLQAARKQYGQAASSRRIVGASAESFTLDRVLSQQSYPTSVNNLEFRKGINLYIPLHKRMEHYMHTGDYVAASECFKRANEAGYPVKSIHIELAVIAHILHGGVEGVKPARDLINKEWKYWSKLPSVRYTPRLPRFMPLFFQQLLQLDVHRVRHGLLLKMALFEFYRLCVDTPNLNFKHHASAAVSRRMIQLGQPKVAIRLLQAVYLSKWRKAYGFDQVQLKLLLRAYAVIGFAKGIWWCLLTVLSRHEPIRTDFVVEAERLMPQYIKHFERPERSPTMDVLRRILWALRKKHDGNSYWAQYKSVPARKQKYRPRLAQLDSREKKHLPTISLEEMIQNFDEEMEMEILLERKQCSPEEIEQFWSEKLLLCQTKKQPETPTYPLFDDLASLRKEHIAQSNITGPGLSV